MSNSVGKILGTGALLANGYLPAKIQEGKKFKVLVGLAQIASWLPGVAAIVGLVRIILGAIAVHYCRSSDDKNAAFGISMGSWSIFRGSIEVLTLGLIAPVNIIVDIIASVAGSIILKGKL